MDTDDGVAQGRVRDCRDLVRRLWLRVPAITFSAAYDAATRCLGFPLNTGSDRFDFDPYTSTTDEFDHLLSQDPTSGSFLSRLPFSRPTRRRRRAGSRSSTDESLTSLLVDTDADPIGDESISMLLTHQSSNGDGAHARTDEELRAEEAALTIQQEAEIVERRQRAHALVRDRGILPHQRPS